MRWRIGARSWYGSVFGPGLLGEFTALRATLRIGLLAGAVVGIILAVARDGYQSWPLVVALLLAGPVFSAAAVALCVGVLTFADAVYTTWFRSTERRVGRLEKRIGRLAERLERTPPCLVNIPVRDALLAELHDEILHVELLHRALPGHGISVADLSRHLVEIADAEHERVLRYVEDPQALLEAGRIVDVPPGPHLVRVFERRGPARASDAYALAVHVLLRRHVLARGDGGDMALLVEAPKGFAACLELDGWVPRGDAAGPVDHDERETMIALWDEGNSRVYTDAVKLLEAARRL